MTKNKIQFSTVIQKFGKQMGEKSGWTYIDITCDEASAIKPNYKKSFRVKGQLDDWTFAGVALIPMGEGHFIMPLNAHMRKAIHKNIGDTIAVAIEEDKQGYVLNEQMMECLQDEPAALAFFNTLTQGHQNYFSKWIDGAKTASTKSKRITMIVNAMLKKWDYGTMLRAQTAENKLLKGL